MNPPICPYCNQPAKLVESREVYKQDHGLIWLCRPCDAWVGVHSNSPTHAPKGELANLKLRNARILAHDYFDNIWKRAMTAQDLSKSKARGKAYQWLAEQMGIDPKDCHIGHFDVDQCKQVIQICRPHYRKLLVVPLQTKPEPYCPECGAKMKLRQPGPDQTFKPFWGCSQYPLCRGTININSNGKPIQE